jgi:glycosyltransferase involved in cell wall biosynthesis
MVLASLARRDWEEQFGMVLAEALAAGVPIVAASSGAIPEVVGDSARAFPAGDWIELARGIAEVVSQPAGRVIADPERVRTYSSAAASERIAAAYDRVLAA